MTNYDYIKNMNVEEMAKFLYLTAMFVQNKLGELTKNKDEKISELVKYLNSEVQHETR